MDTDATLDSLARLLEDEREAICRLDGPAVLLFAEAKERLLDAMHARKRDPMFVARFSQLVPALRRNALLLSHTRDAVRSTLERAGVGLPRQGGRLSARV